MEKHDLLDFIESSSQEIENEYNRILKSAREDPGTAGDQGEENWAKLLRDWLPPIFQIVTKGRILFYNGTSSPQVDILVLRPEYPKSLLNKKQYLAGGVLAAFECKITFKIQHLDKFFKTSINIRDNLLKRYGTPYSELNSGLIFGLLAHSHSYKSDNIKIIRMIEEKIMEQDEKQINHPIQIPDLICIADLATWSMEKENFISPSISFKGDHASDFNIYNESVFSNYIRYSKEIEHQSTYFNPIGSLITLLLKKISWEYHDLKSISTYFNLININSAGKGNGRKWSKEIFSDQLIRNYENKNFYIDNQNKEWDWEL